MPKKRKLSESTSNRRWWLTEIRPVTFRELHDGFHIASAAAHGLPLRKRPSEYPGFVLRYADDSAERMGVTDHWFNRAFVALYDYADRDFPKAYWIHTRLRALSQMLWTDEAKPWVFEEGGELRVHLALIDAASFMPLRRDLWFNKKGFFRTGERIAATATDRLVDALQRQTLVSWELLLRAPTPLPNPLNPKI